MDNYQKQNRFPTDKDLDPNLNTRVHSKIESPCKTQEVNYSAENTPQEAKIKSKIDLRCDSGQQLNPKNKSTNGLSKVNQVSLKVNLKEQIAIEQGSPNFQIKFLDSSNSNHENSQVVIQTSFNNENATDWAEGKTPQQDLRNSLQYQDMDSIRIRKINTADPKQNTSANHYETSGPVILMPQRQTFSVTDKFSMLGTLRPVTRGNQKHNHPQTQKSNRKQLISNGIFLPSENLVILKGNNTVAKKIQSQRPVLNPIKHVSLEPNQLHSESDVVRKSIEPTKGVLLPFSGKVDKSQLNQNLSYAFEITSRPNTNYNNQRNNLISSQKPRTIESRGVTLKDATLNQQFLVSDSIMKQRLTFSYNTKRLELENRVGGQINQKIMDTSFGRLESQSPEKQTRVDQNVAKPSSLLAATLYERTGSLVQQGQKPQIIKKKRPFYQEASFDPSFAAYQDSGSKLKSASQSLTDKAKRMEFDGKKQPITSQQISSKEKISDQQNVQGAIDSRRASFGLDEEVKHTADETSQDKQPQTNEVLFYGNKKVQPQNNHQVLQPIITQKPGQPLPFQQPPATFQKAKAISNRVGTSGNHKYTISDIQIQKPLGTSEALNQQLLQQQAYFQQQRALINQITHQNSKVLKEKSQDESQKAKPQTLRNKSSGAKKSTFSMAETHSKFTTSQQQAQESHQNKFMSNRQPSFAKTVKQEQQKQKPNLNLHVETKMDRIPQKDCLTADSILPKKSLIEVLPASQTQTRNTITNERNSSKTQGQKDQELKTQELTKVKEYIYSDPNVNIGKGKYGPVDLIIVGGKLRALKRIKKDSITNQKRIDHVKAEKKILNFLHQEGDRDFIVKLYDTFTDNDYICFVFEYLAGQDLFWVLQNEHNLALGKQEAGGRRVWVTFYCAEILVALSTLHANNIVYRDLKPDNIMIDNQGHIKLIDFGFSKSLGTGNEARTYTNCGTMGYTAPEVIAGQGYTYSADLWSFGIVLAELLSGSLPFEEKNDPMAVQQAILMGEIKYQREGVDNTARDLLSQIFVVEPNLRIPLERIKQHKFFLGQQPQSDQSLSTAAYWKQVQQKKIGQVPYKPNPMKYQYLLQNSYERISNLQGQLNNTQQNAEDDPSPNSRGINRGNSPLKKTNMLGNFTVYRVNKEFENF